MSQAVAMARRVAMMGHACGSEGLESEDDHGD